MKSAAAARYKFQIKVKYTDGDTQTMTSSTKYTATNNYVFQSDEFTIQSKETESVEVRIQCGETEGEIFIDDWYSRASGGNLSTPLINKELIVISPNPTSDFINIGGPMITNKVLLLDQSGRLIQKKLGDIERLDLEELASGVYFLKIFFQNNTHIVKRIIKN